MLEDLFMKYLQGSILVKFHLNHGVKARINIIDGTALNQGASWKCGKGLIQNKFKRKIYGKEKVVHVCIVIGENI